jgi:hypothetical protein
MCSLPTILNWLKQREKKAGPLEFGVDINAARYKDGTRTTPNGEVGARHTLASTVYMQQHLISWHACARSPVLSCSLAHC